MNIIKSFSRRIFLWSLFLMMLTALLCVAALYYGNHFLFTAMPIPVLQEVSVHSEILRKGLDSVLPVLEIVRSFYIPAVCSVFFVLTLLLWLILRASIARVVRKSGLDSPTTAVAPKKKEKKEKPMPDQDAEPVLSKKDLLETNKRFYLHVLAVLQREGRLVDFFAEDLSLYDDAQIGAAVRSIQDNCKNSMKKYLNPKAVIDQNEGDPITVPAGFDPNAIKLTGNVTGEPPFRGTLRHKGWRATRLELPTLSAVRDASIIAPAEVEIV